MLKHAVVDGQNVSMLVIGEPGSGKTLVRFESLRSRCRLGVGACCCLLFACPTASIKETFSARQHRSS